MFNAVGHHLINTVQIMSIANSARNFVEQVHPGQLRCAAAFRLSDMAHVGHPAYHANAFSLFIPNHITAV